MRVVYTDDARDNLADILRYTSTHYPTALAGFQTRLRLIERRISRYPESTEEVVGRPGVRVVPFVRYPYKLFYRITADLVEVLHLHHAARRLP